MPIAITFGLALGTIFTLDFVPKLYALLTRTPMKPEEVSWQKHWRERFRGNLKKLTAIVVLKLNWRMAAVYRYDRITFISVPDEIRSIGNPFVGV